MTEVVLDSPVILDWILSQDLHIISDEEFRKVRQGVLVDEFKVCQDMMATEAFAEEEIDKYIEKFVI